MTEYSPSVMWLWFKSIGNLSTQLGTQLENEIYETWRSSLVEWDMLRKSRSPNGGIKCIRTFNAGSSSITLRTDKAILGKNWYLSIPVIKIWLEFFKWKLNLKNFPRLLGTRLGFLYKQTSKMCESFVLYHSFNSKFYPTKVLTHWLIFLCRILSSIFLLHCIFYAQCQNETLERVNCLGYVNTTNYLLARFVN